MPAHPGLLARKSVIVIVRVKDASQVIRNVRMATEAGALGAFLIQYTGDVLPEPLERVYEQARLELPDAFIGLNFQDRSPLEAIQTVPSDASALWVDDAGLSPVAQIAGVKAAEYRDERQARGYQGLYFGGVAFKYSPRVKDPVRIARWAAAKGTHYMDVMVTSHWVSKHAPDLAKLRAIKREIGDFPHALTGDLTLENLAEYRPYASLFMMRRALLARPEAEDFSPERIARAVEIVRKTAKRASA